MLDIKKISIIGIGLIGGSLALQLNEKGLASRLIGVDSNRDHQKKALELGLVDEIMELDEAIDNSDVVVLAIPVDGLVKIMPSVLDKINNHVLIDMGSTKSELMAIANKHALEWTKNMYKKIGMHLLEMDAVAHDLHAAYVSHISHITSFALANTVLQKEKEEQAIFELASAGFESTVRLAKSNPAMWVPIFMQNKENVLDVLKEHIAQLTRFKESIEKDDNEYLMRLIEDANKIRRIIK